MSELTLINAPIGRHGYMGVEAMAPMRASFGSMDVPYYIHESSGYLFSTALDLHAIVRVLPEISGRFNIIKAAVRTASGELTLGEQHVVEPVDIVHPYVRAAMLFTRMNNLQVDLQGSVSARMGLGGSSAMMAALLIALWHWKHVGQVALDPRELVRDVSYLELADPANGISLGESHGVQDVVGSLGYNLTGSPVVAMPIISDVCRVNGVDWKWTRPDYASAIEFGSTSVGWLSERLMLFMNLPRQLDAAEVIEKLKPTRADLRQTASHAEAAAAALAGGRYDEFIGHLNESWAIKQRLDPQVVPPPARPFYEEAKQAGAQVIRITGAGNGGFFLVIAEPEYRQMLIDLADESDVVWFCPDATIATGGAAVLQFKPTGI